MKKTLSFVLAAVVALFLGSAAYANYCARDVVPSATLLVPYIAVGMTLGAPDDAKVTTIFGITNVSREAQIVHVTVWDAGSSPEIDFDIILSGYDVWQINWRDFLRGRFDIFVDGATTATPYDSHSDEGAAVPNDPFEWGPDGRETNPGGSSVGTLATPEDRTAFNADPNCDPNPGYGNLSGLSTLIIGKLIDPLVVRAHNGCSGNPIRGQYLTDWLSALGQDPLFFYATADVVTTCNTQFPSAATYFQGIISHANVLIGDVTYLAANGNKSEAMSAVHIESDVDALTFLPAIPLPPGQVTFYSRYSTLDRREPLGTAFAFRYKNENNITTKAIVWKDRYDLIGAPTNKWDDCGYYIYYAWDEDEHSKSRSTSGPSGTGTRDHDPNEFPFETQEVAITAQNFDVWTAAEAPGGWFLLVFPLSYGTFTDPDGANNPLLISYQAWVGVKFDYGAFSGGLEAATLGNYNCYRADVLPALNTYDGGIANGAVKGQL